MFVHRLGCAMPERFAAIAPVGGTLARGFNCAPGPSTPLSLMNVYGSRDDYVSQRGGVSSDGYYYTSAEDVMTGAEVVHCTWNGAHEWPGAGTVDLANDVVWEFFSRHARPACPAELTVRR
jgi:poly(3-hydroxybutyrate) depolymerase